MRPIIKDLDDGAKWLAFKKNKIMKKESTAYLGIDVSKLTLDVSLLMINNHQKEPMITERFENNVQGIKVLHSWLKKKKVSFNKSSLVVMENTGIYHRLVWEYCSAHNLPIHIGNATHIKWSFGIARGKNDRVDSQRLCSYACKHSDELKATPALNRVLITLKDLKTARSSLLAKMNSIKVYLKELTLSNSQEVQKMMEDAHQSALSGLKTSLKEIEKQIDKIIAEDIAIKKNYDLLVSVPGIGHLTAVLLICCTNNFAGKVTGKQLACYAGVVPFEHTSGTSIKGRNRVHKMANKELKKMLYLCATSSIQHYDEFKDYYQRKQAEGKHNMSILNAIKNKIILRAVAVVQKQKAYVDNYKKAA
jgi:transposase